MKKEVSFTNYFSVIEPNSEEKNILDNFFQKDKKTDKILYWSVKKKYIEQEIKEAYKLNFAYYYGFLGIDLIASKRGIYYFLCNFYGQNYKEIIPLTIDNYYLENLESKNHFEANTKEDKYFILKKEVQRQQGIKIVNNYQTAKNMIKNGEYNIIQKILTKPYLITDPLDKKERKINIRIYFLVVLNKNTLHTYIYKDGFLYYTPESFKLIESQEKLSKDSIITSGYIPREIYKRNPLTIQDLRKHIKNEEKWACLWDSIKDKFKKVSQAYKNFLIQNNTSKNCFHVFGADVEPFSELNDCRILEINKFPDLGAKDKRDKELKTKMIIDCLSLVKNKDFYPTKIDRFDKVF